MDSNKVIEKLKQENQQLKEQISKKEKIHKQIISGEYIPANIAEKSLKLNEQSIKEDSENLQQLYSHLGVEAFGEDIQEQAVKEIDKLKQSQKQLAISELEKVKDTVECVLNKALKNSSLNQSYYDRLLDEIDNQITACRNCGED